MKGIILAGGKGTRLHPLTKVTNKHLLPVYNQPMVYYPIQMLARAGITRIMVITGPESAGDFMSLLGSGREMGLEFTYRIQDEPGGIAQALSMAEDFAGAEKVAVALGDNIFSNDLSQAINGFERSDEGARLFLKKVGDPERFGVAEVKGGKIISIEEKPSAPKSNYAVTGLYLYAPDVFGIIGKLKPSGRGELEITDVNNHYVKQGKAGYSILEGEWSDAGTFESLYRASEIARKGCMK
ncbi:MAG: sugar phosphate nucleotidyltransferase [Candidatus Micrarchaeia archaeon]